MFSSNLQKRYVVLLLFSILAVYLVAESFVLGPYSYFKIVDQGDNLFSRYAIFKQSVLTHGFTHYFPYMVSGVDRMAEDLTLFHVAESLFFIFPYWVAYPLFYAIQFILIGYFTYRLCKDRMGIGELGSLAAGLSSTVICDYPFYLQMGFATLPLVFWVVDDFGGWSSRKTYIQWGILALVCSFCSSVAFTLPFTLILTFLWFAFVRRKRSAEFWIFFALFYAVLILPRFDIIHAMQENAKFSVRLDWAESQFTGNFLIGVRSFFGSSSLVPILPVLLILALYFSKFKDKLLNRVFAMLLFCSVGVYVLDSLKFSLLRYFPPFVKGFQANRIYFALPIFYSILVGFAFKHFPQRWQLTDVVKKKSMSAVFLMFAAFAGSLAYSSIKIKERHLDEWIQEGSLARGLHSKTLENFAMQHRSEAEPFRVATVAADFHPAFLNAYGFESADGFISIYPKRYKDFWRLILDPLFKQDQEFENYFDGWGLRVYLYPPKSTDSFYRLENFPKGIEFRKYYNLDLLSLANTKYIISKIPLVDRCLRLVTKSSVSSGVDFGNRWKRRRISENLLKDETLFIYENTQVLPRFFFVKDMKTLDSGEAVLKEMSRASSEKIRQTVFVEKEVLNRENVPNDFSLSDGKIKILEYSPDRIRLALVLKGKGLLVASQPFSPFWKVSVDGNPESVFPVDHAFSGVFLRQGAREVVFAYSP